MKLVIDLGDSAADAQKVLNLMEAEGAVSLTNGKVSIGCLVVGLVFPKYEPLLPHLTGKAGS